MRNAGYILLLTALLFPFGSGEELSSGQRLLQYQSPKIVAKCNIQHEMTIHNLEFFHAWDWLYQQETAPSKLLAANFLFSITAVQNRPKSSSNPE